MRIHWIIWCICNYYDFTTTVSLKWYSTCNRLAAIAMSSYDPPPKSTPVWRFSVDLWGRNGTNQNIVPTSLFDFYTHHKPILHRLVTIHNAADRQSGARAMGRLCYGIGGLKTPTIKPGCGGLGVMAASLVSVAARLLHQRGTNRNAIAAPKRENTHFRSFD